ncbi:PIG-U-domain-containing protein [Ascobolus immersus RN42]|uniref:PIG-U-domain-containing protein n=1 Tax=Ascobolus immersus RN42 TaxID=1160509 RepID=A0A3N4IBN7_ASCIM|nr:PIG-U-domain-containing protein [Ascobolus immersus RN42]
MNRECALIITLAVAVRLVLFFAFPSLPEVLVNRVEISTPVTSFKRLQEGLFLYRHGISPYDGGVFHQAPLLLAFFTTLQSSDIAFKLVYIAADVLSALSLIQIANSGVAASSALYTSTRKDMQWPSWRVAAVFLLNPFTVATCISRSTIVFTNTVVLLAISKAVGKKPAAASMALAMASYLSLYPALIVPPTLLLSYDCLPSNKKPASISKFLAVQTITYLGALGGLMGLSFLITDGSWEFLRSTYGVHLLLPDLTPNVGLWWYFFIEMFDSFREFFLCTFQLHLLIYVGGVTIRLRRQPLFAIITLLGITATFKSYPSIGDMSVYFGLLSLYRHIFPLMRYTFFTISTLLYASLLGPAFYYLWIYAGSGNANFFYAITLVWSLANTLLIVDTLFALLRDEWETERPEMKGKFVVQI